MYICVNNEKNMVASGGGRGVMPQTIVDYRVGYDHKALLIEVFLESYLIGNPSK